MQKRCHDCGLHTRIPNNSFRCDVGFQKLVGNKPIYVVGIIATPPLIFIGCTGWGSVPNPICTGAHAIALLFKALYKIC